MHTTILSILIFVFTAVPVFSFADKEEDSEALYILQTELESNDFNKGNDSIEKVKQLLLKEKLDSFIVLYKPNRQYVHTLVYYAKYISKEDPREGVVLLQQAEKISEENNFDTLSAFISHDLGNIYFNNNLLNEAYTMYIESTIYFKQINDLPAYGYALIDIGNLFFRKDQLYFSKDYYLKSKAVFETIEDKGQRAYGLSVVYSNLGQIFENTNNFDSALFYSKKSLNIRKEYNFESTYSRTYLTLSNLFSSFNQMDSAVYYNQKAVDVCNELNKHNDLSFVYYGFAKVMFKIDTTEAVKYLHKSISIANNKEWNIYLKSCISLANYYKKINIDSALYYSDLVFHKATESSNYNYIAISIDYLINIYHQLGNETEELKYLWMKLNLLEKNNEKELLKNELLYEGTQWNNERAVFKEQQNKNRIIQNFQTIIVILVILFSFFLFLAQRKLKKAAKQLAKSNKQLQDVIRTKDMVYSIVAHDLRGPVGAELELIKMLDDDNIDAEYITGVIPKIRKSMQSTHNLLENLLIWAQFNKHEINLKFEMLNIYMIVIEVEKVLLENAKSKNIEIINNIDKQITAFGDRDSISIIIRNLISNAIKFTYHKGKITITAIEKGDFVEISVSDTGKGMDKETMDQIFDVNKFITNRGTDNEKGSGLGLKLVWDFVEINNGKIWVQSEIGKGSVFTFSIPAGRK